MNAVELLAAADDRIRDAESWASKSSGSEAVDALRANWVTDAIAERDALAALIAERDRLAKDAAAHELEILSDLLMFASEPAGLECCGRAGIECCGNPDVVERDPKEVIDAMAARHRELTAALSTTQPGSAK